VYSTADVISFCILMVWLVPLYFFVCANVGESSLPTHRGGAAYRDEDEAKAHGKPGAGKSKWKANFKTLINWVRRNKEPELGTTNGDVDHSDAFSSNNSQQRWSGSSQYGAGMVSPSPTYTQRQQSSPTSYNAAAISPATWSSSPYGQQQNVGQSLSTSAIPESDSMDAIAPYQRRMPSYSQSQLPAVTPTRSISGSSAGSFGSQMGITPSYDKSR